MGRKGGGRVGEEVQLVRGEIERVIGILKEEKAMERMGYRMNVWKYGGEEMREWICGICNRV